MLKQRKQRNQGAKAAEATAETGLDPAVLASAASVALSWYFFYLKGDKHQGLFVGLWPPTFLAFASYFKQTEMSDKMQSGSRSEDTMREIKRLLQG